MVVERYERGERGAADAACADACTALSGHERLVETALDFLAPTFDEARPPTTRVLILCGLPGVGKSTVARHVLQAVQARAEGIVSAKLSLRLNAVAHASASKAMMSVIRSLDPLLAEDLGAAPEHLDAVRAWHPATPLGTRVEDFFDVSLGSSFTERAAEDSVPQTPEVLEAVVTPSVQLRTPVRRREVSPLTRSPRETPSSSPQTPLRSMSPSPGAPPDGIREHYFDVFKGRRSAVIFDDANIVEVVHELIPRAERCAVIVTSDEQLLLQPHSRFTRDGAVLAAESPGGFVRDGVAYRSIIVNPLPPPNGASLARALAPGRLTEHEAEKLSRLCFGMPGAIALLARATATRLDASTRDVLRLAKRQPFHERLQSLAPKLAALLDRAPADMLGALGALSLFPSSFSLAAARAVLGAQLPGASSPLARGTSGPEGDEMVGALVRSSLLVPCAFRRWQLLDPVRRYARAALGRAEVHAAQTRFVAEFSALCADLVEGFKGLNLLRGSARFGPRYEVPAASLPPRLRDAVADGVWIRRRNSFGFAQPLPFSSPHLGAGVTGRAHITVAQGMGIARAVFDREHANIERTLRLRAAFARRDAARHRAALVALLMDVTFFRQQCSPGLKKLCAALQEEFPKLRSAAEPE
eukprot:gnl/Chilomastix_cuspidata/3165.p1 GENE.gnl/Chilomastix_cuspidata/3165~~gnl/Chilomastix_cuspidata/3165.p1  ORF type:complete len:643 (-),score=308.05 gnl/Chilomastix_cuspidata/3165:730-2658(-)